eukprot:GDKJ01020013.1.p1 GENE.GDKJ01020013.1~~GDKJ01020013.1.p1  ORF type:complete len:256 (+),score=33.87 GDKJ01020013.1:27-770(+)
MDNGADQCAICCDPLNIKRVVYPCMRLKSGAKERCVHYFHQTCAEDYSNSFQTNVPRSCPICRFQYNILVLISEDPNMWFKSADVSKKNGLTLLEVCALLRARMSFDAIDLERRVEENWSEWDADGSNLISRNEFVNNMLPWIKANVDQVSQPANVPSLKDPKAWFSYWDADKSGNLNRHEVARALAKTFGVTGYRELSELKSLIHALWLDFDKEKHGNLTFSELFATDGLIETIVANMKAENRVSI